MNSFYPTIVLGIGTFGGNVVNILRTLVFEELDRPGLPIFRFIHISTHVDNEFVPQPSNQQGRHPWELLHVIRCVQTLQDTDRLKSIIYKDDAVAQQHSREESGWKDWLDEGLLQMTTQRWEHGAGNIRMVGRSLLWNNWRRKANVQTTLMNFIQQITNDDQAIRDTDDVLKTYQKRKTGEPSPEDASFVEPRPRVYIIGSLCGGTGSGMFLDLAYFFRTQREPRSKIFGIFAIPDTKTCEEPGKERLAANALASLIELDFYMNDVTRYKVRMPLMHQPTETTDRPFDFVQIISPRSRTGQVLGTSAVPNNATLVELANVAASSMFFEMLSGTEGRKAAIHEDYYARHNNWMSTKPTGPGYLRGFSSFGAATAHYPKYRIAGAAASQLILEKILNWSGRELVIEPTTGEMHERRMDSVGIPERDIARKWITKAFKSGKESFSLDKSGDTSLRNEWMTDLQETFMHAFQGKSIGFQELKTKLGKAPAGNPLASRFISGGKYAKLLKKRLPALHMAMLDSLKEQYDAALAAIVSEVSEIAPHMPQNLEALQKVVNYLCGEVIDDVKNHVPDMPTEPVDISQMDDIFLEFQKAERSTAARLVGTLESVRSYYRQLILNKFESLLEKANNQLEIAFMAKILTDLRKDLEKSIQEWSNKLAGKISHCTQTLRRQYRELTSPNIYKNMVLVVTNRIQGIAHDVEECKGNFRPTMWGEIFSEMWRLDKKDRSVKDQFLDPKSDHKEIIEQLTDQVVGKLMGLLEERQPFNINDMLLNNYATELTTMAKRSNILVELISDYQDPFVGNHPRLICGGDPSELERVKGHLNREEIHVFNNETQVESSMEHMLHFYQEEAGIAIDDLLTYDTMNQHYQDFLKTMSPESRILHTERDPTIFDIAIYHRLAKLKHHQGDGKPSLFMIATDFISDQFFSWRPINQEESEAIFEWTDHGLVMDARYDSKDPDSFILNISKSEAAFTSFRDKVTDMIEEMETEELVSRRNEIRNRLVDEHTRDHNKVEEFERFFNKDFVNKTSFPWW